MLPDLVVHTDAQLRHVREADAERTQIAELSRLKAPRRQPDLTQGAPEAVARVGIVLTLCSRRPDAIKRMPPASRRRLAAVCMAIAKRVAPPEGAPKSGL